MDWLPYNKDSKVPETILSRVATPGTFYVEGRVTTPVPRMNVKGVGPLSFPVPKEQVASLIKVASAAPYGRGKDTVYDDAVRKTQQLAADQISLGGCWAPAFAKILNTIATGFGLTCEEFRAELYKLLVYEQGGFFKPHRDTEKTDRMFGTLIVVLPSDHAGGNLIISHGGQSVDLNLLPEEPSELRYAAFYADCLHEVLPVTHGNRICLVFNLIRTAKLKRIPVPPAYSREVEHFAEWLSEWAGLANRAQKIVWLLEHHYSPKGLAPSALKGLDEARYRVMSEAAGRAGFTCQLGVVHLEEYGSAEMDYGLSRYGDEWEELDEDFTVACVDGSHAYIDEWRDAEGGKINYGKIPIVEGELFPNGSLDGQPPDEQSAYEATGNAGAEYERSYLRAACVLWLADETALVLLQAGAENALPLLEQLLKNDEKQAAQKLAGRMLDLWRVNRYAIDQKASAQLFRYVTRLKDRELIERSLRVFGPFGYAPEMNVSLVTAVKLLGTSETTPTLIAIIEERFAAAPSGLANLLSSLAAAVKHPADLKPLAEAMARAVVRLPGSSEQLSFEPDEGVVYRPAKAAALSAQGLADLLAAFQRIGEPFDPVIADCIARPLAWPPESRLIPALEILEQERVVDIEWLWKLAAKALLQRSGAPIAEPVDWKQFARWSCACEDCEVLKAFARNGKKEVERFPLAKHRRQHLLDVIDQWALDITHVIERTGSPHKLVCTKTRHGYERRCKQYREDQQWFETLVRHFPKLADAECKNLLRQIQARR